MTNRSNGRLAAAENRPVSPKMGATPMFSIVVPTYHRRSQLRACLAAISKLETDPAQFEVIVVDDGSPSPAHDLVRVYDGTMDMSLIVQRNAGPAAARNAGARGARGRYLAFTDDDCAPAPDWLSALGRHFAEAPAAAVGGQTVNALPDAYSAASQELIDYLYLYYHVTGSEGRFFTSSNLACPKDQFDEVGGFDTSFPRAGAEDREFCERWCANGHQLRYAEDVVVQHFHELSLLAFWQQHFGYGRGAVYLHRARARRGGDKVRLEPLRFYVDLVKYPLRDGVRLQTLRGSLLMVLSQMAYGAGYYRERFTQLGAPKGEPAATGAAARLES
jgi:GT2 family glycosyltransferase